MARDTSSSILPGGEWGAQPRVVLIFGGTFDPPHRGHIDLPARARDAVGADWVLYIPAAQSPHKDAAPMASGRHRLAMVREAIAELPRCSVSDIELRRASDGPSYTIDTLMALREAIPSTVQLRLLIGADQALSLPRWRDPEAVIRLADPIIMRREGGGERMTDLAFRLAHLPWPSGVVHSVERWGARIVSVPMMSATSTQVRALLRHGSDAVARRELARLVPAPVLRYIDGAGLYRQVPGLPLGRASAWERD